jgi:hypothetical protein
LRAFAGAVKAYVPAGWVAPETETAADVQDASTASVDGVLVTEGDVPAAHSIQMDSADSYDQQSGDGDGGSFENAATDSEAAAFASAHTPTSSFDSGDTGEADASHDAAPDQSGAIEADGRSDGETEADDQLAMFGVVRPDDPEPVKARRASATPRRARKDSTAAKRARKTPATRRTPRPKTRG